MIPSRVLKFTTAWLSALALASLARGAEFSDYCRDQNASPPIKAMVALLLKRAMTQDCTRAQQILYAPRIMYLQVGENETTPMDLKPLSTLRQLSGLALRGIHMSDPGQLRHFAYLKTLELSRNGLTAVPDMGLLTSLQRLAIKDQPVADGAAIGLLYGLKDLDISGTAITDLSFVSDITGLMRLTAKGNGITDITPLKSLSRLSHLDLANNKVADFSPLGSLTELTHLDLSANRAGENFANLSVMTPLTKLTWLSLRDDDVADVTPLKALTSLRTLILAGNPRLPRVCPLPEPRPGAICRFD